MGAGQRLSRSQVELYNKDRSEKALDEDRQGRWSNNG